MIIIIIWFIACCVVIPIVAWLSPTSDGDQF